ncbi:MAG: glycosyltransferase family 8 protein [Clostridia bacterium]|nr:glycosyltransferase family 8 protein [Clostridia bacterium]
MIGAVYRPGREVIPVFFAVDDNYAAFLGIALESMLENASSEYNYEINVLTEGISPEKCVQLERICQGRARISFVDISEKLREFSSVFHMRDYYTSATYFRFFIPSMFPQYEKCVYLDCDIIVRDDVSKLYFSDTGDNYVSAVVDDMVTSNPIFCLYTSIVLGISGKEYFNAGILVMNLAALRENDIENVFFGMAKKRRFPVAQDQDYLNIICKGKVDFIAHGWNHGAAPFCRKNGEPEPMIVHYKMNFKPWHYRGIAYEDEFWNYASRTPYYKTVRSMLDGYSKEDEARDERQAEALVELIDSEVGGINEYLLKAAN